MASLKCLACGHNNKVGDESCASCSSSLNLRLCSVCEAINANNAERCHSCGAQFGPETETAAPAGEVGGEARIEEKVLPAAWIAGAAQAARRDRRISAALWLVPALAAAALAYYFYGTPQAAPKHVAAAQAAPVPTVRQPDASAPESVVKSAPATVVKPAPATLVRTGPVAAVKTGPVTVPPIETNGAVEPKRALAPVTHTRAAGVAPPLKLPTPSAAAEPAKDAPATEPAPVVVERRVRVTHTKAEAAAPVEPAAAVAPAAAPKSETTACAPSVAALGLCKSN